MRAPGSQCGRIVGEAGRLSKYNVIFARDGTSPAAKKMTRPFRSLCPPLGQKSYLGHITHTGSCSTNSISDSEHLTKCLTLADKSSVAV